MLTLITELMKTLSRIVHCLGKLVNCKKCQMNTPESDAHLLDCSNIIENCPLLFNNFETEYMDIFGDITKQVCATKSLRN